MPKVAKDRTPQTQVGKFRDAARELGCDENEAAFDERLRKIAKAKASDKDTPSPLPSRPRKQR